MERYNRQIILDNIGIEGQEKIFNSKVLIVGCGGLGTAVSLYLTGVGVGTIGIIDNDKISLTNLHRQLLYTEEDVGKSKVECAKIRLNKINSEVQINIYDELLDINNAKIIFENYDIIIDGLDNNKTRYIIDAECKMQCKPYIYAGIEEYICQVSVFNYENNISYVDLFPNKSNDYENNINGLFGFTAGIAAMFEVNEAIKIITKIGDVLSGKLLRYNLKTNTQEIFKL